MSMSRGRVQAVRRTRVPGTQRSQSTPRGQKPEDRSRWILCLGEEFKLCGGRAFSFRTVNFAAIGSRLAPLSRGVRGTRVFPPDYFSQGRQ